MNNNKSVFHDEVSRKNTVAVGEALKDMYKKIEEQQIKITSLNTALSAMSERMTSLENMVTIQKVKMMGSGPSVVN